MQKFANDQFIQFILSVAIPHKGLSHYFQNVFTGATMDTLLDGLIHHVEKFANDQSKNMQIDKDDTGNVKLFNDYISEYTNNKESKWGKKHLIGDMALMMVAATDTTYAALVYCLLLAAKYADIQEEIYQELKKTYHDNIDEIDMRITGLMKIPKLRAFIHESLRIHPPAPMVGFREMRYDGFKIDARKYDGNVYDLPRKSQIIVNSMWIGRDPKNWVQNYDAVNNEIHKNIDMKRPHLEFWFDDKGMFNKQKNSASLLTFSLGRRDCV
eukprot:348464_1